MRVSRRVSQVLMAAVAIAAVTAISVWGGQQPTLAQGPFPGRPSINVQSFNACTTTNYTDIIAKTLNISSADLRKDIFNGQSVQAIATSANVDIAVVLTAYQTARKADIDQAVKDGVITQDEATSMEATPSAPATRPAPQGGGQGQVGGQRGGGAAGFGGAPQAQFPDISTLRGLLDQASGATQAAPGGGPRGGGAAGFGGGIGVGIGAGTFNLVKQYAVAAQALNMKCADLVKALITPPGQSIVALAGTQKVDPQTISAALTKAYTDALAQDVTDGVITQAQSDQISPAIAKAVTTFINNPLPMGRQTPATPAAQ